MLSLKQFGIDYHTAELPHPEDLERDEFLKLHEKLDNLYKRVSRVDVLDQSDLFIELECIVEEWLDNAQDYL